MKKFNTYHPIGGVLARPFSSPRLDPNTSNSRKNMYILFIGYAYYIIDMGILIMELCKITIII